MASSLSAISEAILKSIENLPECNDSRFDIGGEQLPPSQPQMDLPVSPPLRRKQKAESSKALRQYERTSTEQEQAVGQAIAAMGDSNPYDMVDDDSKVRGVPLESKPSSDVLKREKAAAVLEKVLPTVSGTLSNCVLNFNF